MDEQLDSQTVARPAFELPVEVLELILRHVLRPAWTCMSDVIESRRNNQIRLHILLVCKQWYHVAQFVDPCVRVKASDHPEKLAILPMGCKRVMFMDNTYNTSTYYILDPQEKVVTQLGSPMIQTLPQPSVAHDTPPSVPVQAPHDGYSELGLWTESSSSSTPESGGGSISNISRPGASLHGITSHWETLAEALRQRENAQTANTHTQPGHSLTAGGIELCLLGKLTVNIHLNTLLTTRNLASRITLLELHFLEYTEVDVTCLFHGRLVLHNHTTFAYPHPATSVSDPDPLPNLEHLHLHKAIIRPLPYYWTLWDKVTGRTGTTSDQKNEGDSKKLQSLSLDHVRTSNNDLHTFLGAVCGPRLHHLRLVGLWLQHGMYRHHHMPASFAAIQDRVIHRVARQSGTSLVSVELPGIFELIREDLFTRMRSLLPHVPLIRLVCDETLEIVLTFSPLESKLWSPPPTLSTSSSMPFSSTSSSQRSIHQPVSIPKSHGSSPYDPRSEIPYVEENRLQEHLVLTGFEVHGQVQPRSFAARAIKMFMSTPHARYLRNISGLDVLGDVTTWSGAR